MTFPTIQTADTKNGVVAVNATSWTLTYPTNLASGDLILLFLSTDGAVASGSLPSGFTFRTFNSGANTLLHAAKVSDGTETGNFTYSQTNSEQGAWRIFRITGWFGGTVDLANADMNGLSWNQTNTGSPSLTPDPASLNPANWDVEDTLWFAAISVDTSRTISAYPLASNNTADVSGGAAGATLGVCTTNSAAASLNPGTFTISASDDWAATVVAIRPASANKIATPNTAVLTLTRFAPVIQHKIVTPLKTLSLVSFVPIIKIAVRSTVGKLSLVTTAFAATVSTPRFVTPSTAILVLTRFAPQIRLVVIPSTKGLSTTSFDPKVVIGNYSTPSTKALSLTIFASTIFTHKLAVPATKALSLNSFAPTISTPRLVVIGFDSVDITRFAPNVQISGQGPVIGTASLVINIFNPTVVNPKSATLQTAALATTSFTPVVVLPKLATIGKLSMSVNTLTPTVLTPKIVTVPNSSLQVSTFIPVISSPKFSTPATSNMSLTSYQPQIRSEVIVGSSVLSLTAFNPRVSTSTTITVGSSTLALQTYIPKIFNSIVATPLTKALTTTLYQLVVISSDALLVIAVSSVKDQSALPILGYTVDSIQGISTQDVSDTFPFNDPPQGISNESVKGTKAL